MLSTIRSEAAFLAGAITTAVLFTVGQDWFYDLTNTPKLIGLFVWVFAVMVWCAFAVVRHADSLAELLGEPYGTLILTISVIGIEVSVISAVMLNGAGDADPTLARDAMLAVLIIVLNGIVGVSLLVGGIRHHEQTFNLQGARAFLGVLVTLATVTLVLPRYTVSTPDGSLTTSQAIIFALITVALYATFLALQTTLHRSYYEQPATDGEEQHGGYQHGHHNIEVRSVPYHAIFLVLTLLPIVLLSKKLAVLTDFGLDAFGLPDALGGVLVAILVLTPEGLAAIKAAAANQLQRSVNICLGSALATISLTVPAVVAIALISGLHIELGLQGSHIVLLVLTLGLSVITFGAVRTNMLQGAVHLVIFVIYFVLIFSP